MGRAFVLAMTALAMGATSAGAVQSDTVLPLIEVPATSGGVLALFLSGDGGWAGIDKGISRELAAKGVAVVGLNARAYLSSRKTPERVAEDLASVLRHYLDGWKRDTVILVGYSRGAVIVPFVANRLPPDLKARIALVAMLGLGYHAGFHVSPLDLLRTTTSDKDPSVAPEVKALADAKVRMLCVYGVAEKESYCRDAPDGLMMTISKAGAHHFDGDHAGLAADILAQLNRHD